MSSLSNQTAAGFVEAEMLQHLSPKHNDETQLTEEQGFHILSFHKLTCILFEPFVVQ